MLDTGLIWTHGFQNSNFELVRPIRTFENRILGELGDPKDEGRFDADLKVGHVTFGYSMHYIGPMFINFAEDQIALPSGVHDRRAIRTPARRTMRTLRRRSNIRRSPTTASGSSGTPGRRSGRSRTSRSTPVSITCSTGTRRSALRRRAAASAATAARRSTTRSAASSTAASRSATRTG